VFRKRIDDTTGVYQKRRRCRDDGLPISIMQPREDFDTRWSRSSRYFDEAFLTNDFGHACDVCNRLWFRKDLKSPTTNHVAVLRTEFDYPNLAEFSVCNTCRRSLNSKKIQPFAKTRGFRYPPKPHGLPNLDPIREAHFTDTETPILLCGDFGTDVTQNKSFVNFMKFRFNLDCRSSASTTLGNTCIDLTFSRNVCVQTLPYVSYFSYHRPVQNRLTLNNNEQ
jgi:hypothetical protein